MPHSCIAAAITSTALFPFPTNADAAYVGYRVLAQPCWPPTLANDQQAFRSTPDPYTPSAVQLEAPFPQMGRTAWSSCLTACDALECRIAAPTMGLALASQNCITRSTRNCYDGNQVFAIKALAGACVWRAVSAGTPAVLLCCTAVLLG